MKTNRKTEPSCHDGVCGMLRNKLFIKNNGLKSEE